VPQATGGVAVRFWFAVAGSLMALATAGLLASVPPVDLLCVTRVRLEPGPAGIPFMMSLALGAWVVIRGPSPPRFALWLGACLVAALYVAGLALTFEEAVRAEASCPADGRKVTL
jgi:hypothetical protein